LKKRNRKFEIPHLSHRVLHILILWSLLALASTRQIPVAPLLLCAGIVLYSLKSNSILKRLPSPLWTAMTIIALAAALYYIRYDFFLALLYLFIYLIINKISNPLQKRDEIQVIGICFFMGVASAVITQSLLISLFLAGYLFLFTLAMMLTTFKGEQEEAEKIQKSNGGRLKPKPLYNRKPLIGTGGLISYNFKFLLFLIPATILFFLFIPRFSTQRFLNNFQRLRPESSITGYTESIQLGTIAGMKQNREVALRVQTQDRNGSINRLPHIYMRGTSLDFYDGRRWFKSGKAKRMSDYARTNQITLGARPTIRGEWIRQKIFREPPASPYIFAAFYPYSYIFSKPQDFVIDYEANAIRMMKSSRDKVSYRAYSLKETPRSRRLISEKGVEELPLDVMHMKFYSRLSNLYLQEPRGGFDQRIGELAREITRDIDNPYQRVEEIEKQLKNNYTYSLDFEEREETDPLVEFLFSRKTGHCELFATAMVALCRVSSIPARVVNGYFSEEWNDYGEYFIVRQQDAHSWVEVWFQSTGWISFDPTPPSGRARPSAGFQMPPGIQQFYDNIKFRWYQYVIDYNLGDQVRISNRLKGLFGANNGTLDRFGIGLRSLLSRGQAPSIPGKLKYILYGVGIVLILFTLSTLLYRSFPTLTRRKTAGGKSARYKRSISLPEYENILQRLNALGIARIPSQTPCEYAGKVVRADESLAEFIPITERYYTLRYRHDPVTSGDLSSFRCFREKLKKRET